MRHLTVVGIAGVLSIAVACGANEDGTRSNVIAPPSDAGSALPDASEVGVDAPVREDAAADANDGGDQSPKGLKLRGVDPSPQHVGLTLEIAAEYFDYVPGRNAIIIGGIPTPVITTDTLSAFVIVPRGADTVPQPALLEVITPTGRVTTTLSILPPLANAPAVYSFAGPDVQNFTTGAQPTALVTPDLVNGTDVEVIGENFGSDESKVSLILGRPSDVGAPRLSPKPGLLTPTKMTVHIPPRDQIAPGLRSSRPSVRVGDITSNMSGVVFLIQ